MADDALTNLNWLTSGGNVLNPPTPPSTPPPADDLKRAAVAAAVADVDYASVVAKPPYSYAQLIAMAMQAHGGAKVVLTDIYAWIRTNFAFFRGSDNSWQNSIRHNLSLNRQFVKVPRDANDKGKGSYWMLDPKSFRKDPYCIRRRNFFESQSKKPKVAVDRPQVNPAVKTFLEKAQQKRNSRKHPFAGIGERLEDIGAQECVISDEDPKFGAAAFNQKRFKKEVESYVGGYVPQNDLVLATAAQDERVKVEFNWEGYEYHPSNVIGASLPTIHLSPLGVVSGSISLSPPNSDEVSALPGPPAPAYPVPRPVPPYPSTSAQGAVCSTAPPSASGQLDLHIPGPEIPDWWSTASSAPALLSPPTASSITSAPSSYGVGDPLARMFELRQMSSNGFMSQGGPTFSLLSPIAASALRGAPVSETEAAVAALSAEKEGSPILDVESDDPVAPRILSPAQM